MPKINMLKNARGCPDGIRSQEYVAGECYDVPADLAKCFVAMEVAELHQDKSEKAEPEAPKNKANAKAPKNKSASGDE